MDSVLAFLVYRECNYCRDIQDPEANRTLQIRWDDSRRLYCFQRNGRDES